MLPRILRVVRAKAVKKTALASQQKQPARPNAKDSKNPNKQQIYNPKITGQEQSLQGRAAKLLGKAGAAQFRKHDVTEKRQQQPVKTGLEGIAKTPESIVFEGYRASSKSGRPKDLKLGGSGGGKKKGKPRTRSSKRAESWKKSKK
jgi:nucleolar protein 12